MYRSTTSPSRSSSHSSCSRAATLDADSTHGAAREPILKLLHFLRAMEYETKAGREVELDSLQDSIGQALFQSPTVFNFYLPEYQPAGVVADAGPRRRQSVARRAQWGNRNSAPVCMPVPKPAVESTPQTNHHKQ